MNRTHLPYTLEQLVILRAVAKGGSFKNAAQSLFLTQPAVSLQIQNLEKQLKTNLFDRTKKQIELTEAGTLLLRYSNRILALCEESSRVLDDLSELQSGKLVIGASQTTGTYLMPKIIGLFQQKYPNINVQLNVDSTRKVAWHLMNRQVDIGIVGGKIPKELRKILEEDDKEKISSFYKRFGNIKSELSHFNLTLNVDGFSEWILEKDIIYIGGGNTVFMLEIWRKYKL